MKPLLLAIIIPMSLLSSRAFAVAQFNVEEMPVGAEVTVPGAAKTFVPIAAKIRFASTDSPQTISIVPVSLAGAKPSPVRVAISGGKDPVKYIQIAPGSPFLYSFKGLSSITMQTEIPGVSASNARNSMRLEIESDKPLTVTR